MASLDINQQSTMQHVVPPHSNFFTLPVMHAPFFSGQGAAGVLSSFSQCSRPMAQPQSELLSLLQLSGTKIAGVSATFPHQEASDALRAISDAPTRTPSPPEAHADDGATSNNTIFPRRKAGERTRVNSKPVVLNDTILRQLFTLPLHEAAVRLGISATAMKSACRKLGIKKWPYRSSYGVKNSSSRSSAQSGSDTSTLTSPTCSSSAPSGVMSRFPGTRSVAESSDDLDSLSRDAALLAETMLLLQQGVSRTQSAQSKSNKSSSASSCSSPPPAKKAKKNARKLNVHVKAEDSYSSDTQGCQSTSSSVASSSVRGRESPSPESDAPASVASLLN